MYTCTQSLKAPVFVNFYSKPHSMFTSIQSSTLCTLVNQTLLYSKPYSMYTCTQSTTLCTLVLKAPLYVHLYTKPQLCLHLLTSPTLCLIASKPHFMYTCYQSPTNMFTSSWPPKLQRSCKIVQMMSATCQISHILG